MAAGVLEAANQPSCRDRIIHIHRTYKYVGAGRIRGEVQDRSAICK